MTRAELGATFTIAGLFFLRMLGLFMITPVLALHAADYRGTTASLIGLALGVHGLTQGILQIPFGALSDRLGRKPIIAAGLLLSALGSAIAAMASSIYTVILGRALQGAGAVAGALMALAADSTRDSQRTKALAIIGISIGTSFSLAFVLGPVLDPHLGMSGLFWLASALSLGAFLMLFGIPTTPEVAPAAGTGSFSEVLLDPDLAFLNGGILLLHVTQMAMFVAVPVLLRDEAVLPRAQHWHVYLPALLGATILVLPLLRNVDRSRRADLMFAGAIAVMALAFGAMALWHGTALELTLGLLAFFSAFTFLEGNLPSRVSREAPAARKGAALGVFSTCQYLGIFLGGVSGGWISEHHGNPAVLWFCAAVSLFWAMLAIRKCCK